VKKTVILAFVRRFCRGPNFLVDRAKMFCQELATLDRGAGADGVRSSGRGRGVEMSCLCKGRVMKAIKFLKLKKKFSVKILL
jgi:hypothetical protein